jgi:hypothetical protein
VAGSDYIATNGALTFAPGQTSKTITVNIVGNTVVEPNETFFVNLSAPSGAIITDGQGLGAISNDDVARLSINDFIKAEGNAGATIFTFTVKSSNPSVSPMTVNFATANGTATAPSDYTAIPLTPLVFSPGQTSKVVIVNVIGNTLREPNETFFLTLSGAVGATIFDSQGVGTILNDD